MKSWLFKLKQLFEKWNHKTKIWFYNNFWSMIGQTVGAILDQKQNQSDNEK